MLIPSYAELMDILNKESNKKDEITSRYTIVIAAAKRARQIIDGDSPMVEEKKGKPLSTAVEELYKSKIKVVPEGEGTIINIKKNIETEENFKKYFQEKFKNDELDFSIDDPEDSYDFFEENKPEV